MKNLKYFLIYIFLMHQNMPQIISFHLRYNDGHKVKRFWSYSTILPKSSPNLNSCSIKISHRGTFLLYDFVLTRPAFFSFSFCTEKKGIGIHFRSPLPNINTCILPPHQLCIPPLSDGQHCLTANREPRPWKMLFFHEFFFYRQKKIFLKYKVKNGWFSSPANRVMG